MKKKTLVLTGIAVCAMLLLTSPVLASGGYSKIYGNANEDDTIDMRDTTYIKLVIFGKKPATTFSDANNDGKISMLDVGQTKLIILGKEKQLTLVDMADRVVTVPRPIERVVSLFPEPTRVIIALGIADKLVGVDDYSKKDWGFPRVYPEGKELPNVGKISDPNMELIVSLKPDVVFAGWSYSAEVHDNIQEKTGIPVVCVYTYKTMEKLFEEIEIIGKVVEKEEGAKELVSYFNEKIDKVTEGTSEIPESEKPKIYLAFWTFQGTILKTPVVYEPVDLAGGINVARNLPGTSIAGTAAEVSKEQVIAWNPDIILIHHGSWEWPPVSVEDVLSDPDLQTVDAVKNHKVYYTLGMIYGWEHPRVFTELLYMAKRFHPDKFEDLDGEEEGNEIFKRFYGVDGLWTELGKECGYLYRDG